MSNTRPAACQSLRGRSRRSLRAWKPRGSCAELFADWGSHAFDGVLAGRVPSDAMDLHDQGLLTAVVGSNDVAGAVLTRKLMDKPDGNKSQRCTSSLIWAMARYYLPPGTSLAISESSGVAAVAWGSRLQ